MKKKKYLTEKISLNLYSLAGIMTALMMIIEIYRFRNNQRYGINGSVWFHLRDLLELVCIICIVIAVFYAIKNFLKIEIEEKFEVQEKMITFLLVACVLYAVFGWLFCAISACRHRECMELASLPLLLWIGATLMFLWEKRDFIRDKKEENFNREA